MSVQPTDRPAVATSTRGARSDPLWQALRLLEVDRRRVSLAVLAGSAGLGSAVALAGVSAWLIARASQMPPVMVLNIAAVGVRFFGISRGLMRYVERLVSHDVALRRDGAPASPSLRGARGPPARPPPCRSAAATSLPASGPMSTR